MIFNSAAMLTVFPGRQIEHKVFYVKSLIIWGNRRICSSRRKVINYYLSIAYADNLIEHQTMLENVISSLVLEAQLRF